MSSNYFCLNNIFFEAILVILICKGAFNQFREPVYNSIAKIELPFDGQCSGNGSFMFIVEFRLVEFKDLLLANRDSTTNNIDNCLSFLFCYESSGEYMKPQFKIANKNNNIFWNSCPENWLGFNIAFCLNEDKDYYMKLRISMELRISFSFIEEEIRNVAYLHFHSTKSFFRLQFEPNNFRIFYQFDDDKKIEELTVAKDHDKYYIFELSDTEQQNFSFYDGNNMLQKDPPPWRILLDLALTKKIQKGNQNDKNEISKGHFCIHHPKGCVPSKNPNNQTIMIDCIPIPSNENYLSCEFDKPNDEQCGKRCRKNLTEKHHREALISRGESIIDATKWPWMVAIVIKFKHIYNLGGGNSVETEHTSKCSGTIIHPNYVLTAAHCFMHLPRLKQEQGEEIYELRGVEIYAGHFDLSDQSMQKIEEEPINVIIHENSTTDSFNINNIDVALIKISEPLNFSENMTSICLTNIELKKETIVRIAGWGDKEELDTKRIYRYNIEDNNILQESEAKIIDSEECLPLAIESIKDQYKEMPEEILKEIEKIEKERNKFRYCLQGMDNSTTQKGDSGGPMMHFINGTWFTFGIASERFFRESLEEVPKPIYYVKIDEQLCEWIQINTQGNVHYSGL